MFTSASATEGRALQLSTCISDLHLNLLGNAQKEGVIEHRNLIPKSGVTSTKSPSSAALMEVTKLEEVVAEREA